jgi:hypothetical protein
MGMIDPDFHEHELYPGKRALSNHNQNYNLSYNQRLLHILEQKSKKRFFEIKEIKDIFIK